MKAISVIMVAISLLIMIMIMLLNFISKKTFNDREKSSPFECGFDPSNSARLPFSLQFFLIAIIFIIFDVELVILFPMIIALKISSTTTFILTSTLFLMIILLGTYHEWKQGALNWAI